MAVTTQAALAGLYKQVYADTIYSLIPDVAKLAKSIPFEKRKKLGDEYNQPVVLTAEQGFTYSNADDAFELNPSVPMSTKNAKLKGSQIAARWRISQNAAVRSVAGGQAAFRSATQLQLENVMTSFGKRLEIELLYGDTPLADVATRTNTSSTVTTLTISEANWAIGIWAGMENALFHMYDTTNLVSSGADAIFKLTKVNLETRQLEFTGTTTGTTALQAVATATNINIWFLGSRTNQMAGLKRIMTNTGTLFGINAGDFNLWKTPNADLSSPASPLTFQNIIKSTTLPVGRGLSGDIDCYVSPKVWADLATDLAALRTIDQTYSTAKINAGTQEITYYYQGGAIKIHSHLCVKSGDCFVIKKSCFKRIGSTDITSTVPSGIKGSNSDMFYMLPNNMGYESRMYTDQALFCEQPAINLFMKGFTVV